MPCRATSLNRWQSFVWLWRYDSEAKWFWFKRFLCGAHLRDAVIDNLQCFGVVSRR